MFKKLLIRLLYIIDKLIAKLEKSKTEETNNIETIPFSINWYLMYMPAVITSKKEKDALIAVAKCITKNSEEVTAQIHKMDRRSKEFLLNMINTMLESYLKYESVHLDKLREIINQHKDELAEDTIIATAQFGLEAKEQTDNLLIAYRSLALELVKSL